MHSEKPQLLIGAKNENFKNFYFAFPVPLINRFLGTCTRFLFFFLNERIDLEKLNGRSVITINKLFHPRTIVGLSIVSTEQKSIASYAVSYTHLDVYKRQTVQWA